MKVVSLLLLAQASMAFVTPKPSFHHLATALFDGSRPDASKAIEDALAASKKFGPTSPEARVAWDIVEEIDASDNSAAFTAGLDEECVLTDGEISAACMEYNENLEKMKEILADYQKKLPTLSTLATSMKKIKMNVAKSIPGADSPQIRAALAEAQAMTKEHGADSSQARVAWAELEEIASSGLSNAMGTRLDEECLLESAVEACEALEEVTRILEVQNALETQK